MPTEKKNIEITPDGEQEHDWKKVVDLNPQGYLELNDGKNVIHGPLEKVSIDDDNVTIALKWAATMPAFGQPGFGKWKNLPEVENKTFTFPNYVVPFVIEETPEKGPRVRFDMNIMYINEVDGIDPAKVEGLKLS